MKLTVNDILGITKGELLYNPADPENIDGIKEELLSYEIKDIQFDSRKVTETS